MPSVTTSLSAIDQIASQPANENQRPDCRALVPLSPAARHHRRQGGRRTAEFTVQLIAAKDKLPQARERRRAEPAEVLAAYRAAAQLTSVR